MLWVDVSLELLCSCAHYSLRSKDGLCDEQHDLERDYCFFATIIYSLTVPDLAHQPISQPIILTARGITFDPPIASHRFMCSRVNLSKPSKQCSEMSVIVIFSSLYPHCMSIRRYWSRVIIFFHGTCRPKNTRRSFIRSSHERLTGVIMSVAIREASKFWHAYVKIRSRFGAKWYSVSNASSHNEWLPVADFLWEESWSTLLRRLSGHEDGLAALSQYTWLRQEWPFVWAILWSAASRLVASSAWHLFNVIPIYWLKVLGNSFLRKRAGSAHPQPTSRTENRWSPETKRPASFRSSSNKPWQASGRDCGLF